MLHVRTTRRDCTRPRSLLSPAWRASCFVPLRSVLYRRPANHNNVWFAESLRFVKQNRDEPFLLYLSLNAAHCPYVVVDGAHCTEVEVLNNEPERQAQWCHG